MISKSNFKFGRGRTDILEITLLAMNPKKSHPLYLTLADLGQVVAYFLRCLLTLNFFKSPFVCSR